MGTKRARLRIGASMLPLVAIVPLAACSFGSDNSTTTTTPVTPASPSPSATPSPSSLPSPSPSPSPSGDIGPIEGAPAGTPVTPEIFMTTVDTDAGQLRVIVFVPNVYEDGGRCTVTVVDGAVTITKENTGQADVSSTACGQFTFALGDLPSGSASVTASYESSKYSGSSAPEKVAIP
jgi:xyloglucan-specific exo-beta-1,4-glucanase